MYNNIVSLSKSGLCVLTKKTKQKIENILTLEGGLEPPT